MSQVDNPDAFRILIATDNHIGYKESDPIRGRDSFRTFEEILKIAKREQVDFILLGGDLFHHNQPSRMCLYETMSMIRRHCFGGRENKVWIASDQSVNFSEEFCQANYLDENLNVSMPIFSIHGNHDDPGGTGFLCALNLLSVAGMVNYFGASPNTQDVAITPILMQKGQSKLALYGLGNIREERLHRQWRSGKVTFLRPQDEEGEGGGWNECFNMFVFHQNRARHGPTSHIPEEFLDSFLDLIVWGHEHECRIVPERYHSFSITQPGSSVATSLSEGESESKYVGLLTVQGQDYTLDKIRLRTVRPLQFTTVQLSSVPGLRPSDSKAIQGYLEGVVETLIERAKLSWEEQQRESASLESTQEEEEEEMPLPLIRVRVDYSGGYETFNANRFGHRFIKRVANPNEILKFQRLRPDPAGRKQKISVALEDLSVAVPEKLDQLKVEDLVNELLSRNMSVLPETGLEDAVLSLINKHDKDAVRQFIAKSVDHTKNQMSSQLPDDPQDLTEEFVLRKSTESKASQVQPSSEDIVQPIQQRQGNTRHVNLHQEDDDDDLLDMNFTPHTHSNLSDVEEIIPDRTIRRKEPIRKRKETSPIISHSSLPSTSNTPSAPKRKRILPSSQKKK